MPMVLSPAGMTWCTGHDNASQVRTSASAHVVTSGYGGFGASACATPDPAMSASAASRLPSTTLMHFLPVVRRSSAGNAPHTFGVARSINETLSYRKLAAHEGVTRG